MSMGTHALLAEKVITGLAWVAYRVFVVGMVVIAILSAPASSHDALLGGKAFRAVPEFKTPPMKRPTKMRPQCAAVANLAEALNARFQETLTATGYNQQRSVVLHVYTSASGTFSVVLVSPDGTACMMDNGQGWQFWENGPAS